MKPVYIISAFILTAVILFFIFYPKSKETFTTFEENLLNAMQTNSLPTFIDYLNFLTDNKNQNINLVSESVYNSLKNKKKLTVEDIKSFI